MQIKRGWLVWVALGWCTLTSAVQADPTADSLRRVLNATTDARARFELQTSIGRVFLRSNLDSALHYFQANEPLARVLGNDSLLAVSMNMTASVFGRKGKFVEARKYLQQAASLVGPSGFKARILVNLSNVEVNEGNRDRTTQLLNEALAMFQAAGDTLNDAFALGLLNASMNLTTMGQYQAAVVYLQRASHVLHAIQAPPYFHSLVASSLGQNYRELKQHRQAMHQFLKAKRLGQDAADLYNYLSICNNLAFQYIWLNQPGEALAEVRYVEARATSEGLSSVLATVYQIKALAFSQLGKADSAFVYNTKHDQAIEASWQQVERERAAKYDLKAKEAQINLNAIQLGQERTWRFMLIGSIIVMSGLISALLYVNRKRMAANRQLVDLAYDLRLANGELQAANDNLALAHRRLRESQLQIVHGEKMAALGRLASAVAHEINNPITAAEGSAATSEKFLRDALEYLPSLMAGLNEPELKLFQKLIAEGARKNSLLSTREEREVRKKVSTKLHELMIPQADDMAMLVVQLGIHGNVVAYLPLMVHPKRLDLFKAAAQLSATIRNQGHIRTAVSRAHKIARTLKSYAGNTEREVAEPVDVQAGIESVLALYQYQMRFGIELTRDYAAELPQIMGLPDQLNQVWTNLIHNALQAMTWRGHLTIRTMARTEGIAVQIIDSGPGIPLEISSQIFEPFFTTKGEGEGTGLGLDISLRIVQKHGGTITVDSLPGNTCFTVQLPYQSELAAPDGVAQAPSA